ncbi:MAG: hypothetical protein ACP5NS_00635 [Candidatus Pacearchaeota archaeon]
MPKSTKPDKNNSSSIKLVREIRKLGPEIKEIKQKTEDLEEEIEEEEEARFERFISGRVSTGTSTLTQSEIVNNSPRERRIAKEDESEINFRPSYTGGGNPYSANKYTPVGSAESSSSGARPLGERPLEPRNNLSQGASQNNDSWRGAGNMESGGERNYAGTQEQNQNERRRKSDL